MPKMGKKGRGKKKTLDSHVPEYASDDERLYGHSNEPDPLSSEYMYDDIDEFHAGREKVLLDKGYTEDDVAPLSDEEEVLDLDSEESDDDEIRDLKAQLRRVKQLKHKDDLGSDIDGQSGEEDEEGLPDSKAWGARRSKYYGDDDIDMEEMDEDDAEAVLEEKEALRLQRQMAEQLDDQDFGLDIFPEAPKDKDMDVKEEKIVKDLSKLSKKEKLKLLKKESPELLTLIEDFKLKMLELQEKLCPLKDLIARQSYTGKAADYVHTKFKLNLNYCMNIVFYLMMKAKQASVHNHPVIKRLLKYKNIMKQLEPLDVQMEAEVEDIVGRLRAGEEVALDMPQPAVFVRRKKTKKAENKKQKISELVSDSDSGGSDDLYEDMGDRKHKNKKGASDQYETKDEKAALEYYEMMKAGRPGHEEDEAEDEDMAGQDVFQDEEGMESNDLEGKRAINYQIEKNKGLTAHKKKELRNPRVKHRMKFRKAKIRRKGQFREPRTEMQKYGGEISGIRAAVKRGIKLK